MGMTKMIPEGYMTVGEIAQKMNTTVRTLQYYDKQGLLPPSGESEGGRRLYTDKDIVLLHQIQSLKYLGFSLEDIKNRLIPLDTPEEVASALTAQAAVLHEKIDTLTEALNALEKLRGEVVQMETVNFKLYADVLVLLQQKNENYWVLKHFDDKVLSHIRSRFDEDSGTAIITTWKRLCEEIAQLRGDGLSPESARGQAIAKEWWEMVLAFTGGDMSLLPSLEKFAQSKGSWNEQWREQYEGVEPFIEKALAVYFMKCGKNPFVEVSE
jgi:DNA-binding transcriptional MerR regulator